MSQAPAARPPGRVLSTLNEDGSRRWIRPRPSPGGFWRARRAVAVGLMVVFLGLPYLRMNGRPLVLLDIPRREFTLLGTTFLPTDTLLLMLLMLSVALAVFLLTAMFGRVWCGWACPQTVYMEFLFRPIERWLEGGPSGSLRLDGARRHLHPRRLLKHAIYLALALVLAHTFLAYFVGVEQLAVWVRRSPVEHPTSFLVMAATTALVFADFAWFREQTCIVACPYGRLQSVLLDQRSLIVGYDPGRGEPRQRGMKHRPATAGDCIDCQACVLTCPTGIDIRDGLQMECIHCTQCADACDAIMDRIGRPRGLVRYASQAALAGGPGGLLRPRVVLYPAVLALAVGLLAYNLGTRADTDVTLLRGVGAPFTREPDGHVVNQVRIKLANRSRTERAYQVELAAPAEARLVIPVNPVVVAAGRTVEVSAFILLPEESFAGGEHTAVIRLQDGTGWRESFTHRLLGPGRGGAT